MVSCPDEIEADFQQYYGINFETSFDEYSVRHISLLAAQLPPDARCFKSLSSHEWSEQMHMLANMEHELRMLIWIQANQYSKHRTQPPKRIQSPAERKKFEQRVQSTDIDELNRILGIKGGET